MKRTVMIAALFIFACLQSNAGGTGSTGANYLKVTPGLRATGMGGAYTALAKDSSAVYWNPAGLGLVKKEQISLMHLSYIEGMSFEYGDCAFPIKDAGTLGAGVSMLNSGNMDQAGEDSLGNYVSLGSYNYTAVVGTVSFGRKEGAFGLGLSAKVISDQMAGSSVLGVAFDAGLIYETPVPGLTAGFALFNAGPSLCGSALPLSIKAGVGYEALLSDGHGLSLAADGAYFAEGKISANIGGEYLLFNSLALRGGYMFNNDSFGLTAGVGIKIKTDSMGFSIDYSYIPSSELGLSHRFGVGVVM